MRKLIFIGVLFKVQISLAFGEGDPTQSCFDGKGCLSNSQCGENGICQFSEMTLLGKPSEGSCDCKDAKAIEDYQIEEYDMDSVEEYDYGSEEDSDLESDENYNQEVKNDDLLDLNLNMNIPSLSTLLTSFQDLKSKQKSKQQEQCSVNKKCSSFRDCAGFQCMSGKNCNDRPGGGRPRFCCCKHLVCAQWPKVFQGKSESRIHGGFKTSGPLPYQLRIDKKGKDGRFTLHCGAILFKKYNVVVTAAHCLYNKRCQQLNLKRMEVVAGAYERRDIPYSQIRRIKSIYLPWIKNFKAGQDKYCYKPGDPDIAVLYLKRKFRFRTNEVQIACLSGGNVPDVPAGKECYVSGWGKYKYPSGPSKYLKAAKVQVFDDNTCRRRLKNINGIDRYIDGIICTTPITGGMCRGDSGGPLVCKHRNNLMVAYGTVKGKEGGVLQCGHPSGTQVYFSIPKFLRNFKPSKQKGFDLEWLDSYNQYMGWFNGTYADDDTDEDDNDYGDALSIFQDQNPNNEFGMWIQNQMQNQPGNNSEITQS